MVNSRRSARRNYDRASTCDDDPDTNDEGRSSASTSLRLQTNADSAEDVDTIQIQILDSAQNKFTIPSVAPSTWTVQQLKDIGCDKHGVPPLQQRLIYMGKLLNEDTAFLSHYGIEKDLSIIHLFPKPNVVIDRSGGRENTSLCSANNSNDNNANAHETAHIPQIILDASEAERHSSVIILSSHEAFEILHRVRLCAFCLLVYSSMELLQDLTLWMGKSFRDNDGLKDCDYDALADDNCMEYKPDEPTDTTAPSPYGDDGYGVWESWNYIDVLISLYAFYVAMLGIKVTTEHERKTARLFWILLLVLAVTWNGFYYWNLVREIKEERNKAKGGGFDNDDQNGQDSIDPTLGDMSPYNLALWYMSFLFLLWFVFLFWARQFKNLMEEAGAEADDRTRNLTSVTTLNEAGYGGANNPNDSVNSENLPDTASGDFDLELQVEGRTIT